MLCFSKCCSVLSLFMSKDSVVWSDAPYSSDRCKNKIRKQTKKPPISYNTDFFLRLKICSEYTPAGLVLHYLFGFFGLMGLFFWLVPISIYLKAVNYTRNISVELVFIPYSYLVSETNFQFFFTHGKPGLSRICFVHKNWVGKITNWKSILIVQFQNTYKLVKKVA